ncbi:MAG: MerR family transcriptional regulator [Clostridia bacterium]|nr:MerR family transcriptional regulator [Clostridia bacterium]
MRYPIGDVARTLGVTHAGLHYFEKQGVIAPTKGDMARRTYSIRDFIRLVSYRKYRNMEMPLKVIAGQFSAEGDSFPVIRERVQRQAEQAEQMARRYMRLAEDAGWFSSHIDMALERMDRIEFAVMPSLYLLSVGDEGCISGERQEQQIVSRWLSELPGTRVSVISDKEGNGRYGYTVAENRAEELHLTDSPAWRLEGKNCIHTFTKVTGELFDQPDLAFVSVRRYMRDHNLEQDGLAVAVILCVQCHGEELNPLLEVYAPFK